VGARDKELTGRQARLVQCADDADFGHVVGLAPGRR
jgi:hypothetical protein